MDIINRLAAIEDIKQLKARYFRHLDLKDWDGLAEVFAGDAIVDARNAMRDGDDAGSESQRLGEDWAWHGRAAIVAGMRMGANGLATAHHGYTPEIEILSDVAARGIWAMEDIAYATRPEGKVRVLHGLGHYHETYQCTDGCWRIASMRLTRIRVQLD